MLSHNLRDAPVRWSKMEDENLHELTRDKCWCLKVPEIIIPHDIVHLNDMKRRETDVEASALR